MHGLSELLLVCLSKPLKLIAICVSPSAPLLRFRLVTNRAPHSDRTATFHGHELYFSVQVVKAELTLQDPVRDASLC